MKFTELNLSDELISGLNDIRFLEPTPIQEKAIPPILEGRDIIGTAQTGTGKTGAFVIPMLQRILKGERDGIKAIILTPTRELAQQIDEQIFAIGYHTGITSATVIGGSDFSAQAKALKAGVDVIVATPGRFIDQKKVVNIDLSRVEYLVLDEADRMLDMGFLPDMKKIIDWLPGQRQTLLFSATMPKEIERLASSIMKDPVSLEIARSKPAESVEQRAYFLLSNQKIPVVKQIFDSISWDSCIIFTSTKKGTDELQRLLKKKGIRAGSIHGDRSQEERNKALDAFKSGKSPVIVATNVIARGIDIKNVSMIINYDVPRSSDDYVHRIGRTGRYDKSGIAITLVTRRDSRSFDEIERIKGNKIRKIEIPDWFDESSQFTWDTFEFDSKKGAGKSQESSGKRQKKEKREPESEENRGKRQASGREETKSRPSKRTPKKEPKQQSSEQRKQRESGGRGRQKSTAKEQQEKRHSVSDNGSPAAEKKEEERQQAGGRKEAVAETRKLPKIEKAIERNRHTRKPAKGIWGIVKSILPTFRRD